MILICVLFLSSTVEICFAKTQSNPIVNLGNSLVYRLENATEEHGELLLKDFYKYFNMLDDIYTLMRSESGADVCKGMAVFDVIEELGGPPHVGLQLDYKLIEEKFKWNDSNETEDIKTILKDTRELWVAMEERANRLRHGIPDPDTEEDNKPPGVSSDSSEGELH
uniref:Uncharacterized protein n=1 Tax=Homalodisca liturata TaxID=320908 RepID=A0A1B6HPV7_9HEMI